MASVARRAGRYDFPSFGVSREEWKKYRLTAYLAIESGFAIGYASVIHVTKWQAWEWDKETPNEIGRFEGALRPTVNMIFVCKAWRRKGIATKIVRRVASDASLDVGEIPWGPPFTEAGKALAVSLRTDGILLVG